MVIEKNDVTIGDGKPIVKETANKYRNYYSMEYGQSPRHFIAK